MKHAAILRLIQRALKAEGLLRFTEHALDEMDAEGESERSVRSALRNVRSIVLQDNARYRVRGDGLVVVLHIEGEEVRVWTVYAG